MPIRTRTCRSRGSRVRPQVLLDAERRAAGGLGVAERDHEPVAGGLHDLAAVPVDPAPQQRCRGRPAPCTHASSPSRSLSAVESSMSEKNSVTVPSAAAIVSDLGALLLGPRLQVLDRGLQQAGHPVLAHLADGPQHPADRALRGRGRWARAQRGGQVGLELLDPARRRRRSGGGRPDEQRDGDGQGDARARRRARRDGDAVLRSPALPRERRAPHRSRRRSAAGSGWSRGSRCSRC